MKTPRFKIIDHGSRDWKKAVQLREDILRRPLGSRFTKEELEEEIHHIQVAGFIDGDLIATAVLVPENGVLKMQRVVVDASLRNDGIGTKMMAFCEKYARTNGFRTIYCHARDSAVSFYLNCGYTATGSYFQEDGVPHLRMEKTVYGSENGVRHA